MRKSIFAILILMCLTFTIAASDLRPGAIHDPYHIIIGCSNATAINLSTVMHPNGTLFILNQAMNQAAPGTFETWFNQTDQLGRYDSTFQNNTCAASNKDSFEITLYGTEPNIWAYGFMIALVILLLIGLVWFNIKFNKAKRKELHKKAESEWAKQNAGEDINLGELIMLLIGLALLKVMYAYYYIVAFIFSLVFLEFVDSFGIGGFTGFAEAAVSVIIWGFIPIFLIMIFMLYNMLKGLMDNVIKILQGVADD